MLRTYRAQNTAQKTTFNFFRFFCWILSPRLRLAILVKRLYLLPKFMVGTNQVTK